MRTAAIHSGARRIYGILGTAIVVRTRGGTPVRVGVFVDVCVGVEDAHAVKPLECRGPTQYSTPLPPLCKSAALKPSVSMCASKHTHIYTYTIHIHASDINIRVPIFASSHPSTLTQRHKQCHSPAPLLLGRQARNDRQSTVRWAHNACRRAFPPLLWAAL